MYSHCRTGTDRYCAAFHFDYHLPEELIAQEPPAERDGARMLVLNRVSQRWEDRRFRELPEYLTAGDCVVLNDSRVLPSRLFGQRTGGEAEVMLLEPVTPDAREWRALVKPGRRLRTGTVVRFDDRFSAEVVAQGERGERTVRFPAMRTFTLPLNVWGICRCRLISSARIAWKIVSVTRPCSRANAGRWQRPRRDFISLARCWSVASRRAHKSRG